MFGRPRNWQWGGLAGLVGLLLLTAACGESSDSLSTEEATRVADAAVLQLADLPGEGWTQEVGQAGSLLDFSTFSADGSDPTDTPECAAFTAAAESVSQALEGTDPVAETNSGFRSGNETTLELAVVTSSIAVFPTVGDAETAAQAFATLVNGNSLKSCFESVFNANEAEGLVINQLDASTPDVTAPGGTAVRVDLEAVALIFPINLTIEIHSFQRDHTLAVLLALGLNSDTLGGDAAGVITQAFAQRVEAASE